VGERVKQHISTALSESRVPENGPPGFAIHNASIVTRPRPLMVVGANQFLATV
jgi:hypothetical protein